MVVSIIKQSIYKRLYKIAVVSKKIVAPFVPAHMMQQVKRKLLKSAFPIEQKSYGSKLHLNGVDGINLIGYARAEMGIGESCRIAAKSLTAADLPFGIINFKGTNSARMSDMTWVNKEMADPVYDVNVFHINAEQMIEIYSHYGNDIFLNKYNIGYWHWELPDFPDRWTESFSLVQEIWAPSTFVAEAIAMKSPVPVVRIPHSIEVTITEVRDREYFKLPAEPFLFLTMYDVKSYNQRKNPKASVESFKHAFQKDDLLVGLVVKVNSSDAKELKELNQLIGDYSNIYIITEVLSRNDTNALLHIMDCYISLHRSEGFGLGLAEAMYLGKPVIGTNWSSNIDFMNSSNSCLVDYELVQLGETYGPYEGYQFWAEPDTMHAASYMRRIVEDIEYRNRIAHNGKYTIQRDFSPKRVGELIRKRLEYIKQWNNGG